MKNEAQPGDTVELKDKDAGFFDAETNFKVVRDQKVKLGDNIGARTNVALLSGGLVVVGSKTAKSSDAKDDKPKDDKPKDDKPKDDKPKDDKK